jgi:hypothetical protein
VLDGALERASISSSASCWLRNRIIVIGALIGIQSARRGQHDFNLAVCGEHMVEVYQIT